MALPTKLQETFTPAELSFMAEQETISIIPRQSMPQLPLISGPIPRLRPPQRTNNVPIWLATLLKRQRRATIVPPEWMTVDRLREFMDREKRVGGDGEMAGFSALPSMWIQVSEIILDVASDDVPDAELVRRLLRDLREIRQAKARDGLEVLEEKVLHMDNIGLGEVNEIRVLFSKSMDVMRKLKETRAEEGEEQDGEEHTREIDMEDEDSD